MDMDLAELKRRVGSTTVGEPVGKACEEREE